MDTGTLLARIETGDAEPFEVRSLLPGFVSEKLVEDGTTVTEGQNILVLAPSDEQVWEALRGLYLVGQTEDLETIQNFTGRSAAFRRAYPAAGSIYHRGDQEEKLRCLVRPS